MYYQSNSNTLKNIYRLIVHKTEQFKYNIIGNLYEEDVIDYLSENNPDNYSYRIAIQVEKK